MISITDEMERVSLDVPFHAPLRVRHGKALG